MKKKMIRKPASVIIAGPSGSGKSELVEQLLKEKTLFYLPPKKVAYCYDRWQPRFHRMKKHMQFYKGLPPQRALAKWFKPDQHGILFLDDLMEESGNDKRIYLPKILITVELPPRISGKISFHLANLQKQLTTMPTT